MARSRRRVRVNPRFYIILALVVGLGIGAVLLFKPGGKSGTLTAGEQTLTATVSAVMIREESCLSVERYDRVTYQVQEGAQVTADMPVATVYKWGYTDDMTQSLLTTQQQVYEKQMELLGSVESAELSNLNAQIQAKKEAIRTYLSQRTRGLYGTTQAQASQAAAAVEETPTPVPPTQDPAATQPAETGQPQETPAAAPTAALPTQTPQADLTGQAAGGEDLLKLENDLKELLTQRSSLLRQSIQADEQLNQLYAEEDSKQAQLLEYVSNVSAKGDGVVSFYFDGYEQVLSAEKLDVVNADLVNKVLEEASGGTSSSDSLLFRLVNPNHWYLAFVTPRNQALRLCAGQVYAVQVEGYADRTFMGTALEPVVNENGIVNLLEFTEDMGELMSVRTMEATLTAQASGLEVPLEAIGFGDGVPVLEVEGAQVPLDILSADEDTAIVAAKEGSTLQTGMRYGK